MQLEAAETFFIAPYSLITQMAVFGWSQRERVEQKCLKDRSLEVLCKIKLQIKHLLWWIFLWKKIKSQQFSIIFLFQQKFYLFIQHKHDITIQLIQIYDSKFSSNIGFARTKKHFQPYFIKTKSGIFFPREKSTTDKNIIFKYKLQVSLYINYFVHVIYKIPSLLICTIFKLNNFNLAYKLPEILAFCQQRKTLRNNNFLFAFDTKKNNTTLLHSWGNLFNSLNDTFCIVVPCLNAN